jgi:hypothetical protein
VHDRRAAVQSFFAQDLGELACAGTTPQINLPQINLEEAITGGDITLLRSRSSEVLA